MSRGPITADRFAVVWTGGVYGPDADFYTTMDRVLWIMTAYANRKLSGFTVWQRKSSRAEWVIIAGDHS
jgi:hypothetical protein